MLFNFNYIDHEIYKVGEIPSFFLQKSITANNFSKHLFPVWFQSVISGLPGLNKKFKDVFVIIKRDRVNKAEEIQHLVDTLVAGYDIGLLCEDENLEVPKSSSISADFHQKLKDLFGYFFETTLKESKTLYTALDTTYNDHYFSFRTENLGAKGKVCPICGLHEYPLSYNEPKAQYDHWLPQDIYPLLSINFKNLIPICGFCNLIKHNRDLLHNSDGSRTISFYPYKAHPKVVFEVSQYTMVDDLLEDEKKVYKYGKLGITITTLEVDDEAKIQSWDRVFNIKERSATYISDYYDEIKLTFKEFLDEKDLQFNDGADKIAMVESINQFTLNRIKPVRREKGAHLKKAFLDFLCIDGNEYLLYTFLE